MLKITTIPLFDKIYKVYQKKYKNLENDLKDLINILQKNPEKGIFIKNNIYKIRVKNSDNNKGKSGGYRFIYFYKKDKEIIFSYMYSKSDISNIDDKFIENIISELSEYILN